MKGKHVALDAMEIADLEDDIPEGWIGPTRNAKRNKLQLLPFIGWDGEGYTDSENTHHYQLFGNSVGGIIASENLEYRECFDLLLNAPVGNHVIYGGDYDVIMMTKTMPVKVLDRLLHGKPVRYDGYRMQWYRKKYLILSNGKQKITLYDVMTFFGTSFVNACIEYLGDSEELQAMKKMKLARDSFTLGDPTIVGYWQSELRYLVDLMNRLRELLLKVGIRPSGWHGPGAVAGALLTSHRMGNHMEEQPEQIVDLAERAYYGGRFEHFKVGIVENAHEYDIRSAYPAAIRSLPSLVDVQWDWKDGWNHRIHPYGLYCVSWDIANKFPIPIGIPGPLPFRSPAGNIYYPMRGCRSWYWGIEVRNLQAFKDCFTIHESWTPTFTEQRPFDWVEDMYTQRAAMKELGNPAQLAVKLGLNSLYGKLAQSKGADFKDGKWTKPRWHQAIYAGWITAYTRRKLFQTLLHAGNSVIAVETDAIFTERELVLRIGKGLGEWEHTPLDKILYIHSGVYYALKDGVWKLKSRGVEVDRSHSSDYWLDIFSRLPQETVTIDATIRRFGTVLSSKNYANWYDFKRSTVLPSLKSKRIHYPPFCLACINNTDLSYLDCPHNLSVPEPILQSDITPSTPYPFPWRDDHKIEWPKEWIVTDFDDEMEIAWQAL